MNTERMKVTFSVGLIVMSVLSVLCVAALAVVTNPVGAFKVAVITVVAAVVAYALGVIATTLMVWWL